MGGSVSAVFVEEQLSQKLVDIEAVTKGNVLTLVSNLYYGVDDLARDAVEGIGTKSEKLTVVLESEGGSIDIAERIANTFRNHYKEVDFVVPNYAYSAGTILAMSGDSIHMDYYSVLGPIDPQVRKAEVGWVPALGYLIQYENLIEKSRLGTLTTAEMAFLLKKFDPAELHAFEQAKEQTITLLKQWLVQYKFKDWNKTDGRGIDVTLDMKKERAEQIANKLNDTKLWHSHGRGIPMQVLVRDVGLKIDDFGANDNLNRVIRAYYKLLRDYSTKNEYAGVIHAAENFHPIEG